MVPAVSVEAYDAARHRVASIDRSSRGRIVVAGPDRASYLQGLLTNDIAALKPGLGCYAAYLTAQGRMIADLNVYELGDVILLTMEGDTKDTVLSKLDQLIFSEDVQLGDVTATFAQTAVIGPDAAATVSALLTGTTAGTLAALPEHGNLRALWDGAPAIVAPAIGAAGAVPLDLATAEAIRLEAGVPRFHRDMDEETIPLEAGIESRAISFTKGCYVGQEVVIRVLHRGHGRVVRKLVGLLVGGNQTPGPGAGVRGADRDIGRVTSSAFSPALQRPIALAYVHRDFVAAGTMVTVDGANAEVTSLPFVSR